MDLLQLLPPFAHKLINLSRCSGAAEASPPTMSKGEHIPPGAQQIKILFKVICKLMGEPVLQSFARPGQWKRLIAFDLDASSTPANRARKLCLL